MSNGRIIALILGTVLEFAAVVAILLALTPEPRAKVDFLVIGTLATFVALATLFGVIILTRKKAPVSKRDLDDIS